VGRGGTMGADVAGGCHLPHGRHRDLELPGSRERWCSRETARHASGDDEAVGCGGPGRWKEA
jgi:hypothetical protein